MWVLGRWRINLTPFWWRYRNPLYEHVVRFNETSWYIGPLAVTRKRTRW